jgi:hypothetical protein
MQRVARLLPALTLVLIGTSGGCASTCRDLQEICDQCIDPNQRASCEASVDADDQERCELDIDSFEDICK